VGGSRRVTQLKIWVVPCATATLNWPRRGD